MRFFSVKPLKLIHGQCDLGYMYLDLKSRKGKPPARAHFATKWGRRVSETKYQLPVVSPVYNFHGSNLVSVRLSHSDLETLFHEFDNALHSSLSITDFQHLSGTRVALDFSETPSNLSERLITNIDGVDALNNVLLIGMTNRKDMLDEALMRPGRLEVQVEISLPDENGQLQILQIHTNKMKDNSFLSPDVNLQEIAARSKNYSGAELEGVVKSAFSYALRLAEGIQKTEGIEDGWR